jgi:uncharacterized damage-inducible protein DinB
MNEMLMLAKYNKECDQTLYDILSKMTCEERERDRGGYYKSLADMFRHVLGGTHYILGLCRPALNKGAYEALGAWDSNAVPEGPFKSDEQWANLGAIMERLNTGYAAMTESLSKEDLLLPVKIEWYNGNPDSVPLSFLLHNLSIHGIHHRGQISQVLDTQKIDNDFSMLNVKML